MKELFCENYKIFLKSIEWLEISIKRCEKVDFENLNDEDIEKLETLASRFSRSVDILINKFLRSLDILELEDISRKLDIVIRAEKRGFVEDYEELIILKDLRNELSHEYIEEIFLEKIKEVLNSSFKLFEIKEKVTNYIKKYSYCKEI